MSVQIQDMRWSIYSNTDSDDIDSWVDDTTTTAPDGVYKCRAEMFDYRSADNNEWPPKQDYTFLIWESDLPVEVKNGHINKQQALDAAGHLMHSCGYHGVFLEGLDFDPKTQTFDVTVGS